MEKSKEEIQAERKAKKLAKQAAKGKKVIAETPASNTTAEPVVKEIPQERENQNNNENSPVKSTVPDNLANGDVHILQNGLKGKDGFEKPEKPTLTKAERRAIQEQQRAAKAAKTAGAKESKESQSQQKPKILPTQSVKRPDTTASKSNAKNEKVLAIRKVRSKSPMHQVRLVSHLYIDQVPTVEINSTQYHPSIVKFNSQYEILPAGGPNSRCVAFLNAVKDVISDYVTPPCKDFARGIESVLQYSIAYLQKSRSLDVCISNAVKFIKWVITQLDAKKLEKEEKEQLIEAIDTYVRDQIDKAGQAIKMRLLAKITNNDVILIYGYSALIAQTLEEAQNRKKNFRVIIVDSRPHHDGRKMLEQLTEHGIKCTCVLISAVGFIMEEVTKIFLYSHALLANGYVMGRTGTAQVALIGKTCNKPVLVCCETHKFSERVQTDAFVFNEIGNPNSLILTQGESGESSELANWQSIPELTPLNLIYDVTPPNLVTAVITEIGILPCTSAPVILRIKPSEIGY